MIRRLRPHPGLVVLIILGTAGYLLVTMPPVVIDRYQAAQRLSPAWGYVYLATVIVGSLLLAGIALWMLVTIWRNTRRKDKSRQRRGKNPSQLSRADQERELRDNLAAGDAYVAEGQVSTEVREQIRQAVEAMESKIAAGRLEIVAFGTISSGKSSLLNALAGRELFRTDPRGGTTVTRSEVPWPAGDKVYLTDTPGLAEVAGEARAAEAAAAAQDADLVVFVVDGPLKAYEFDLLKRLSEMEKRAVICLNKEDWFEGPQREELLGQLRQQVAAHVAAGDVVAVRARPSSRQRVRVLPDGTEQRETAMSEADIAPLAERMLEIVSCDGRDLLLANLLLQSRGLVETAKRKARATLDAQAEGIVSRHMWAAGGAAAVNPIPLLDLAGGSAITVKMVLDLARVYRQSIDVDTVVEMLGQLTKNLVGMLGVTAAAPAVSTMLASLLKTVPGIGTIAGGLLQGLVQALLTRWIGNIFIVYFQDEMQEPEGGLAELARRQWQQVTKPAELIKLVQTGRKQLGQVEDDSPSE